MRRGTLSLREQRALMQNCWPGFQCALSKKLICRGSIRPSELSCSYRVRIEYQINYKPRTFVEDPRLQRRQPDDEAIPHTYSDEEVCLFRPFANEWNPTKPLATTIVPWFITWLFFYEIWLATGEWHGGGEHPAPRVSQRRNQSIDAEIQPETPMI